MNARTVDLVHVIGEAVWNGELYASRATGKAEYYDTDDEFGRAFREHLQQAVSDSIRKMARKADATAPDDLPVKITTSRETLELEPAEGVEDHG